MLHSCAIHALVPSACQCSDSAAWLWACPPPGAWPARDSTSRRNKMLKRTVRSLVASGIAIVSATVLTALGATDASGAATAATQPGHTGAAANTVVQAAPAAHVNALAHVPATLATLANAATMPDGSPAQSASCPGYSLKDDGQTQGGGGYYLTDEGHNQIVRTTGTGSCWDFFGVSKNCPNGGCFLIEDLNTSLCLNVASGYVYADSCQRVDHNEWWWLTIEPDGSNVYQNPVYRKNLTAVHVYPGGNGAEVVVAGGPASPANLWWETLQ